MAPLALVLLVAGGHGPIAASCFTAGVAAGAAWRGRAIDRAGFRAGLCREAALLAGASLLMSAAIGLELPLAVLLATSAVLGVTASAVGIAYRAALAAFVPRRARSSAYSIDAAITEASFVISPVLVAGLVAFAPPIALFASAGMLAAVSALAARGLPQDAPRRAGGPPPARTWVRAAMPVYLVTGGVGIAYGLLVASLPERLAELGWSRASAGVLFAVMSGVSMLVGLVLAARGGVSTRRVGPVAALLLVFAAATALLAITRVPGLAVAAMALFGLPLSPLSVIGTARLTEQIPGAAHAQALAVFAAAVTTTSGIGLALAALLIGLAGPAGALAASSTACVLAAVALLAAHQTHKSPACAGLSGPVMDHH
jgi:hypothetical protein